jgi:hypothetical protein
MNWDGGALVGYWHSKISSKRIKGRANRRLYSFIGLTGLTQAIEAKAPPELNKNMSIV